MTTSRHFYAFFAAFIFAVAQVWAASAITVVPDDNGQPGHEQDETQDEDEGDESGEENAEEDADEGDEDGDKKKKDLPLEATRTVTFDTDEGTWISLDVSPDGGTIIFELLGDIYTMPTAGGDATLLLGGMAFESQPAYSPDGAKIAFTSDRDGSENLWIANADGTEPKKLSSVPDGQSASPAWSPDSQYVYVSQTNWSMGVWDIWMYHAKGGKGVQITKGVSAPTQPGILRANTMGVTAAPDGEHIYFATKQGGFSYNAVIPNWQISRRNLISGQRDPVLQSQGSAFRPEISPDGNLLVYGTRRDGETGLRIRNLTTGDDRWLAYPVQRDDQESRYTRDVLPNFSFVPDGSAIIASFGGKINRVDIGSGDITPIPFNVHVEMEIGPRQHRALKSDEGPVRARVIQNPSQSPDGSMLTFSALGQVYVMDLPGDDSDGTPRRLTSGSAPEFHPNWSADGRWITYVTWTNAGGDIWKARANGRGQPQKLSTNTAYYTDPVFTPDGTQVVALRGSNQQRISNGFDFGPVAGTDIIRLPAAGGDAAVITHAAGLGSPHFSADPDRLFVYSGGGLMSMRLDGTDRRSHIQVKGPGAFGAPLPVPAADMRISPDGKWALANVSNQLHLVAVPQIGGAAPDVNISAPSLPHKKLTDIGSDYFGWADGGNTITWGMGSTYSRQAFDTISWEGPKKDEEEEEEEDDDDGENGDAEDEAEDGEAADDEADAGDDAEADTSEEEAEENTDVEEFAVVVEVDRDVPSGVIALTGAKVITMDDAGVIDRADIIVSDNRITAVGPSGSLDIPAGAHVIDATGTTIVPGFVDSHAHWFEVRRGIIDVDHWNFVTNLAYGVTAGLDVQTATNDMFTYQDLIDAGRIPGPRNFSTGPGVFSNNAFKSKEDAVNVLKRYRDHYGTRNIKAYISGNRKQRQFVIQASEELGMMPTTEGALDLKLDLSHMIDGFAGTEHALPIVPLYKDVVQLAAQGKTGYTPTLLVSYGGPWAENYFYTREPDTHGNAKLNHFTPHDLIDAKTRRRFWFRTEEHIFPRLAEGAGRILRAGGLVGIGSHGQLQGLGYHWEMWALSMGADVTPLEVLQAATISGAEIIGRQEEIGSITPGKFADLVILNSDPTTNIRNTEDIRWVMKNGRVYEGDTLDQVWPDQVTQPPFWFQREGPGE